jgi:hypothetical protein
MYMQMLMDTDTYMERDKDTDMDTALTTDMDIEMTRTWTQTPPSLYLCANYKFWKFTLYENKFVAQVGLPALYWSKIPLIRYHPYITDIGAPIQLHTRIGHFGLTRNNW